MRPRVLTAALLVAACISLPAPGYADAKSQARRALLRPKVLVLNYDPIVESEGGKRLHEVCRWNDPHKLAAGYAAEIKECSGGTVDYRIVEWIDADEYPVKTDGFTFTDETYLESLKTRKWHQPDSVNYRAMIGKYRLAKLVDSGKIDEVWVFGAPYFGYFESCMAGKGAFWINGDPLPDVKCRRVFAIMGFNYERGVGEMLEDLGHRTESTMSLVFGGWEVGKDRNDWERFTLYDKVAPGRSACGNVHYAPNSASDYDWGNKTKVWSTCGDWLTYPKTTGAKRLVDSSEWGGGDTRAHHVWWFKHLPKAPGKTEGKLNNWWLYVVGFNKYILKQ